jgi:hypothetical protein
MPRRIIEVDGETWEAASSGRVTQYLKDEFALVFTRVGAGAAAGRERRVARFSPLGAKSRELALAELTDAELAALLARSQPSWTAPEMGYRR